MHGNFREIGVVVVVVMAIVVAAVSVSVGTRSIIQLQQRVKFRNELGLARCLSLPCSSGSGKDLNGRKLGSNLGNSGCLYICEKRDSHLVSRVDVALICAQVNKKKKKKELVHT